MSLRILPDLEQRSEEWHAQRCGMVTASTMGRLVTATGRVADNDTSRAYPALLVAERITGHGEPFGYMSDDMVRGVEHEPAARQRYADHNKVNVLEVGFCIRDDWGFSVGASPDGLVGDDGGIEIKCPRPKAHIATIVADRVPVQYMAQVQTALLVTGRDWWDFVSFCAGLPMWTKRVTPHPVWQAAIVRAVSGVEEAAAQLLRDYLAAAAHLPTTEPILEDIVI